MNSLRCSNCSFLNFATASACKRCGLPIGSDPSTEWVPPPYDSTEYNTQPAAGGAYFQNHPTYPPYYGQPLAPASSGSSIIVKIGVALAVIFLVSFIAIPALLKHGRANFTNLSWSEYRSPDGKFSVSLPVAPKVSDISIPSPMGTAQAHMIEADVNKDGGCMLMYADYPIEHLSVPEETLYDMALQGAAKRQSVMGIGARRYILLSGHRGIEAELNPTDPKMPMSGGIRIFWISPRLYVILAGGPNTPEFKAVQTKCFESFKLNGGV